MTTDDWRLSTEGLLLDVDGVLHVGWQLVPGAAEMLASFVERDLPFCLLTNTTTLARASLAARLRGIGLPVRDEQLVTAPVATAAYLRRHMPAARCYLIAKGDVAADFQAVGLTLVGDDESADAVVIGGAEELLTYERLNHAFRLLMSGAKLIAMHRNRFWRTAGGLTLDSGPFVRALEEAAGVRATVIGKPALPFFRAGLHQLGLPASVVTMVGDDARNDLAPARRLGLHTVLVRTGKPVADADLAHADLVVDSIAQLEVGSKLPTGAAIALQHDNLP